MEITLGEHSRAIQHNARSLDSFPRSSHKNTITGSNESRMQDRLITPSPRMERDPLRTSLSPHRSKERLTSPALHRNIPDQLSGTRNHFAFANERHLHDRVRGRKSERDRWKSKTEFILMLIGYTVGLGNVWKFPYLCHINGGASFLIPYGIMLAIEGIPLYYMELCIGQRMRKGSIGVWNEISPYLGGVGLASVVVCFLVSLYYNVIIAWCVFYFFKSFQNPLPWSSCPLEEVTVGNVTNMVPAVECEDTSATTYFWYRTTLGISSSIDDSGGMNWKLCGCLVGTWTLVWLCMMKGIKVTGKIVYVTATLPLVLLIIFFFRGVHLKGYQEGLALLFIPEFSRLKDPLVWLDAAIQVFYSLGVAYGSLIAFSSYNPIKNDSTRDAITVCLINCATSIYASVVVFCFIGFEAENKMERCMKNQQRQAFRLHNSTGMVQLPSLDINEFNNGGYRDLLYNASTLLNETLVRCNKTQFLTVGSGQGLAFIIFTDAINKMPFAPIWAVMFFLMLITVGIDTEFGMLEGVVTPVIDLKLFPRLKKEHLSGIICLVSCLLGLPLVQYSGAYWFQLIDAYCSGIPLLIIALVECISICFIYGLDRFSDDIKYMTNKPPRFIWRWCWKVISPTAILAVLSMSIKHSTAQYEVWDRQQGKGVKTPYPPWAKFMAVFLTLVSILFIPAVAFLRYFRIIGMGNPELPAVVLDREKDDQDASELQPLYKSRTGEKTKTGKISFARRKFRLEVQLAGRSESYINGPAERMININGHVYQLVNQRNGVARFV